MGTRLSFSPTTYPSYEPNLKHGNLLESYPEHSRTKINFGILWDPVVLLFQHQILWALRFSDSAWPWAGSHYIFCSSKNICLLHNNFIHWVFLFPNTSLTKKNILNEHLDYCNSQYIKGSIIIIPYNPRTNHQPTRGDRSRSKGNRRPGLARPLLAAPPKKVPGPAWKKSG
jgi:hypothetical protein